MLTRVGNQPASHMFSFSWTDVGVNVIANIISTVVVALLVGLAGYIFRRPVLDWIRNVVTRALSLGVYKTYRSQKASLEDLALVLSKAERIRILTHRGKSLFDERSELRPVIRDLKKDAKVSILLGDPNPPAGKTNFAELRGEELNAIDGEEVAVHLNNMRSMIIASKAWEDVSEQREVRLHNTPTIYRMFITETDLFIMFYSPTKRAQDNRVFRCVKGSELYQSYERAFDFIWEHSAYAVPREYYSKRGQVSARKSR